MEAAAEAVRTAEAALDSAASRNGVINASVAAGMAVILTYKAASGVGACDRRHSLMHSVGICGSKAVECFVALAKDELVRDDTPQDMLNKREPLVDGPITLVWNPRPDIRLFIGSAAIADDVSVLEALGFKALGSAAWDGVALHLDQD